MNAEPATNSPPHSNHRAAAIALAIAATAVLGFYPDHVHIFTGDGLEQVQLAQCLDAGGGVDCAAIGYWPPLYPLATWLVATLLGNFEAASRLVALLAAGAVPGLVCVLTYRLARHLSLPHPTAAGVLGAGLTFGAPHLIFYGTMGDNRGPYLLTVALTLWATTRLVTGGGLRWAWAAGAFGGFASLTRPEGRALVVLVVITVLWASWRRQSERSIRAALTAAGAALGGAFVVVLPYLMALSSRSGGLTVEPRRWEMAVIHWAPWLPKDLILGLMGFTVHGTPLRGRMLEALGAGEVSTPDPLQGLALFVGAYLEQVPATVAQAVDALPFWLLLAAPVGAAVMIKKKAWPALAMLGLALAPYLLFPGLPQSTNDKVPTGNFLSALIPLSVLAAVAAARLGAKLQGGWSRHIAMASALLISLGVTAVAVAEVLHLDSDLKLFEGHALPRAAGSELKGLLPEGARLVTTYPGTAVAHFAGVERTPMPTSWELGVAMERWRDKPTVFVIVFVDLFDRPLLLKELMKYVPEPCEPIMHMRGDSADWVFACQVGISP